MHPTRTLTSVGPGHEFSTRRLWLSLASPESVMHSCMASRVPHSILNSREPLGLVEAATLRSDFPSQAMERPILLLWAATMA